jgi:hypothetical protein
MEYDDAGFAEEFAEDVGTTTDQQARLKSRNIQPKFGNHLQSARKLITHRATMSHTSSKKLKLNTSNEIGSLNGLGNPVFSATFHN